MWFLQPGMTLELVIIRILVLIFIIFFILPMHEFAHGFVAYKLGDSTAKYEGRLSLNPLKHIDPIGAIVLLLFGFGWAKPVPIDQRNFKNRRLGMALTAIAGPISNLLAAFIGALILNLLIFLNPAWPEKFLEILVMFLYFYIFINVGLAVFNLLPIPPLDGSRILGVFLPQKILMKFYQYERPIMIALFILLSFGVFSKPIYYLQTICFNNINKLAAIPFGL